MFLRLILFLLLITSCSPSEQEQFMDILANAPDAGPGYFDNLESYSLALGSYVDSACIKYHITEPAPLMTMEETEALVEEAVIMWGTVIDKPFVKVGKLNEANIYFTFEFMDGRGGIFGTAEPPPYFTITNWNREITLDKYDINPHSEYDAVTIIGHEVGHSIGLRHSFDNLALMNEKYIGPKKMSLDDHFGARILYKNKKKFKFGNSIFRPIEERDTLLTPNFKMKEFYSKCVGFSDEFHFIDAALVTSIQIIRDYYEQPIQIISSYRDYDCNLIAGGATFSRHKQAKAIDWKFIGSGARTKYHRFSDDIKNQVGVFPLLISCGIRGFGAYNTSFHIDTRSGGNHYYGDLDYALWGKFVEDGYTIDFEHMYGIDD